MKIKNLFFLFLALPIFLIAMKKDIGGGKIFQYDPKTGKVIELPSKNRQEQNKIPENPFNNIHTKKIPLARRYPIEDPIIVPPQNPPTKNYGEGLTFPDDKIWKEREQPQENPFAVPFKILPNNIVATKDKSGKIIYKKLNPQNEIIGKNLFKLPQDFKNNPPIAHNKLGPILMNIRDNQPAVSYYKRLSGAQPLEVAAEKTELQLTRWQRFKNLFRRNK